MNINFNCRQMTGGWVLTFMGNAGHQEIIVADEAEVMTRLKELFTEDKEAATKMATMAATMAAMAPPVAPPVPAATV